MSKDVVAFIFKSKQPTQTTALEDEGNAIL
jgi:hypothetical protein